MALTRRDLLKSGVAVAATSSISPLFLPRVAGAQGKRGGILRVRGYDPPHFDPHQTLNFKTNNTPELRPRKARATQGGRGSHTRQLRRRA
jgi:hypothetical protein